MNEQLAKYFSGECTQDEIDELVLWRNESSDNSKAFFEAKKIWIETQAVPEPNMELLSNILGDDTKIVKMNTVGRWKKIAVAAAIVLTLAFTVNLFLSSTDDNVQVLADGSEVVLHTGSSIQSINITDEIREVRLTGRAYFDIERDESRPFIITTDNAKIEVLGTSFMIDATSEITEVCVESGLVSLIKPGIPGRGELSVKLSKGEMGLVSNDKKGIVKKNNDNANYLAWKTKTLTFNRSKMADVELVLEDVYGIDIEFENDELKNCNLTAKFKERRAKDAIEIIAKTFNLTFDIKDNKVTLRGKGC